MMVRAAAARAVVLPEGGDDGGRGGVRGALPARVRRPRVHARQQPAGRVRARHRRLHLRGREHRAAAADCQVHAA